MFSLGFTGTRAGMTRAQHQAIARILVGIREPVTLHHGACLGADLQMHDLVRQHKPGSVSHAYPATGAPDPERSFDHVAEPKPPLKRNPDIVAAADLMIATPKEMREAKRGGTWATIRCSQRTGTPLVVVFPDGSISDQSRGLLKL